MDPENPNGNSDGIGDNGDGDGLIVGSPESKDNIRGEQSRKLDPAASATSGSNSGNGSEPRRRGRKPGSKNSTTAKAKKIDLSGIESILFSAHAMLSALTKVPELEIDQEEAKKLAHASTEVAKHYVSLDASEKTVAWVNLGLTLGAVYGPRIMANGIRKRREREERRASARQPFQNSSPQNPPNAQEAPSNIYPLQPAAIIPDGATAG